MKNRTIYNPVYEINWFQKKKLIFPSLIVDKCTNLSIPNYVRSSRGKVGSRTITIEMYLEFSDSLKIVGDTQRLSF